MEVEHHGIVVDLMEVELHYIVEIPILADVRNRSGAGFLSGIVKRASKVGSKIVKKGARRIATSAKKAIKTQRGVLRKKATGIARKGNC